MADIKGKMPITLESAIKIKQSLLGNDEMKLKYFGDGTFFLEILKTLHDSDDAMLLRECSIILYAYINFSDAWKRDLPDLTKAANTMIQNCKKCPDTLLEITILSISKMLSSQVIPFLTIDDLIDTLQCTITNESSSERLTDRKSVV